MEGPGTAAMDLETGDHQAIFTYPCSACSARMQDSQDESPCEAEAYFKVGCREGRPGSGHSLERAGVFWGAGVDGRGHAGHAAHHAPASL